MNHDNLCFLSKWSIVSKLSNRCVGFVVFLYDLFMSARYVLISSVSILILLICVFSLLLCQSCQKYVNIIDPFKEFIFCFIDFLNFLFSILLIFALHFFHSACFGFICSSRFLKWELRLSFSSFLMCMFSAKKFPSQHYFGSVHTF